MQMAPCGIAESVISVLYIVSKTTKKDLERATEQHTLSCPLGQVHQTETHHHHPSERTVPNCDFNGSHPLE